MVKKAVPGPYTFIMQASKALPKQITDFERGTTKVRRLESLLGRERASPSCAFLRLKLGAVNRRLIATSSLCLVPIAPASSTFLQHRRTVGVRIPADPLCRELLGAVDGPLLVSTAPTLSEEGEEGVAVEDEERVSFVDLYDALVPRGLDFVVRFGCAWRWLGAQGAPDAW